MSFTAAQLEDVIESEQTNGDGMYIVYRGEPTLIGGGRYTPWGEIGYSEGFIRFKGETYPWKSVEEIGGEGQGDYAAVIFSVKTPKGTRLFRKEGFYSSYDGTDWDGNFAEVETFQKTVTDYRAI